MSYRVALVCTDRGQHRRMKLGEARQLDDGRVVLLSFEQLRARLFAAGEPIVVPSVTPMDIRYPEIVCPKCGRNPRWRAETWQAAMPKLRDAGVAALDISALPF